MVALAECDMARRNDVAVKLDMEVVRDAKVVASFKTQSLAEYLSELIRPLVERDLKAEYAKRMAPSETPKKPKGRK